MRVQDNAVDPMMDPRLMLDDIAIEQARVERVRVEEARFETLPELKRQPVKPMVSGSLVAGVSSSITLPDAGAARGLDEALLAYIKPEAGAFALLRDAPHKRLGRLAQELTQFGEAGLIASRIIQTQADAFESLARNRAALVKG
jgi:hypothetical protein